MTWTPWDWLLDLHRAAQEEGSCPDEDEPPFRTGDAEDQPLSDLALELEIDPWKLGNVGAWVGFGTFRNNAGIDRDLKLADELGLTRLDVIVNDHSGSRQPRVFSTYNKSRIEALCKRANDQGIEIHLMSWWMPHASYIHEGAKQLVDLVDRCGARSVMLDAEEPWTQARRRMDWDDAAALTAQELREITWGVTGIGYAPTDKLKPLVELADYMVPQCYSTSRNSLDPATAAPKLCGRWRRVFGDRPLVIGLAGYRQKGRIGYTKDRFMTTAYAAAKSQHPTDIVYWSLRHIRSSHTTSKIIRKLTRNKD